MATQGSQGLRKTQHNICWTTLCENCPLLLLKYVLKARLLSNSYAEIYASTALRKQAIIEIQNRDLLNY